MSMNLIDTVDKIINYWDTCSFIFIHLKEVSVAENGLFFASS